MRGILNKVLFMVLLICIIWPSTKANAEDGVSDGYFHLHVDDDGDTIVKMNDKSLSNDSDNLFLQGEELKFNLYPNCYHTEDTPVVKISEYRADEDTSFLSSIGENPSISLVKNENYHSFSYTPDSTVSSFSVYIWWSEYDLFSYDEENELCLETHSPDCISVELLNEDLLTEEEKSAGYPKVISNAWGDRKAVYPLKDSIKYSTLKIRALKALSEININGKSISVTNLVNYQISDNNYEIPLDSSYFNSDNSSLIFVSASEVDDEDDDDDEEDTIKGTCRAYFSSCYDENDHRDGNVWIDGESRESGSAFAFTVNQKIEFRILPPSEYIKSNITPIVKVYEQTYDDEGDIFYYSDKGELSLVKNGNYYSFSFTPTSNTYCLSVYIYLSEVEALEYNPNTELCINIEEYDTGTSIKLFDDLLTETEKEKYPEYREVVLNGMKRSRYIYPSRLKEESIKVSIKEGYELNYVNLGKDTINFIDHLDDYDNESRTFSIKLTKEMYDNNYLLICACVHSLPQNYGKVTVEFNESDYASIWRNGVLVSPYSAFDLISNQQLQFVLKSPVSRTEDTPVVEIIEETSRCEKTTKRSTGASPAISLLKNNDNNYYFTYTPDSTAAAVTIRVWWSPYDEFSHNDENELCYEVYSSNMCDIKLQFDDYLTSEEKQNGYPKMISNAKGDIKYIYPKKTSIMNGNVLITVLRTNQFYDVAFGNNKSYTKEDLKRYEVGSNTYKVPLSSSLYENGFLYICPHINTSFEDFYEGTYGINYTSWDDSATGQREGNVWVGSKRIDNSKREDFTTGNEITYKILPHAYSADTPVVVISEALWSGESEPLSSINKDIILTKEGKYYYFSYTPNENICSFNIQIYWSIVDMLGASENEICVDTYIFGTSIKLFDDLLTTEEKNTYPKSAKSEQKPIEFTRFIYPDRFKNKEIVVTVDEGYDLDKVILGNVEVKVSEHLSDYDEENRSLTIKLADNMFTRSDWLKITAIATEHKHTIVEELVSEATCQKKAIYQDKCESCGKDVGDPYEAGDYADHIEVVDKAVEATCTKNGKTEGRHCYICKKVLKEQKTIKAGHKEKTVVTPAKVGTDGKIEKKCERCKKVISSSVINQPYITVADTAKYTGKEIKQKVTVTDKDGKAISTKYYSVKYKNNIKEGKATVTITFTDRYKGTISKNFIIVKKDEIPASVSGFKATADKKAIKLSWKAQTKNCTGYEIQYSLDKNFLSKDTKTITVSKAATKGQTISKLTSKKTYFVRIRSCNKSGKNKVYSSWSKASKVTVK